MDSAIQRHEETGASFIMTKDGKEELKYSCGLSDVEKGVSFDENTICKAFSCSKVATSAASMILLQEGKLDLEWNLEWFIPEFANPVYIRDGKEIPSRSVKIRDLLNMTSGIPYPGGGEGIEKTNILWGDLDKSIGTEKPMTTLEFARRAGKCPLMFEAGHEWQYGSSADIMGAVIEILTGQRYGDFLAERIFEPLGMNDTAFYVPKEKADRLAVLYENNGENPKPFRSTNLAIHDTFTPPAFESGGAGLFTTASDYSKLGAMLANGGVYNGTRILGRKTIDFMSANALSPAQRSTFLWDSTKGYGYANFVRMITDANQSGSLASTGSFGWDGWTGTYLLADPKENISVTLFVQRCGGGTTQLARSLVNAVYGGI